MLSKVACIFPERKAIIPVVLVWPVYWACSMVSVVSVVSIYFSAVSVQVWECGWDAVPLPAMYRAISSL